MTHLKMSRAKSNFCDARMVGDDVIKGVQPGGTIIAGLSISKRFEKHSAIKQSK